jgi:hypothetical protein
VVALCQASYDLALAIPFAPDGFGWRFRNFAVTHMSDGRFTPFLSADARDRLLLQVCLKVVK